MEHAGSRLLHERPIHRSLEQIPEEEIHRQIFKLYGEALKNASSGRRSCAQRSSSAGNSAVRCSMFRRSSHAGKKSALRRRQRRSRRSNRSCSLRARKLRAELGDCRKAPHIDALLHLLTQQQRQRKPVADGAAPILHQPQNRFTHAAQRKIKLRVERIRRIDRFVCLLRQEADWLLPAKQQTRRLRAGDGKRDLLRRAVFLQKARMAGADPAKSLLSERLLQLAKSVLRQERAFPVFKRKQMSPSCSTNPFFSRSPSAPGTD